jgi:hypothetical protein
MIATASEFRDVAGFLAVIAAVFAERAVRRDGTGAGGMRARGWLIHGCLPD